MEKWFISYTGKYQKEFYTYVRYSLSASLDKHFPKSQNTGNYIFMQN
jgi:hypothetical protein